MSKELISSIDIDAPAPDVWQILVDFGAYATWNSFITSAEGLVQAGSRLTLRMQPVGGSAVTLRPTLVEVSSQSDSAGGAGSGCQGCSTPTTCSLWNRVVLPRRDWCSRSTLAVCWCRSSGGRWTGAPSRHSMR